MEEVEQIEDKKHPLIREALRLVGWEDLRLEITSMADIPWITDCSGKDPSR
jgi:hypothetical protein